MIAHTGRLGAPAPGRITAPSRMGSGAVVSARSREQQAWPARSLDRSMMPHILWVDLDLDFEVTADHVEIDDEAEFHEHARTMGYPDEVVRGAWSGISTIAPRYTNGDWPFDGSLQDLVDRA